MIHLICGPIGAGKTTHAIKIAKLCNAIRFSEDEWLEKLFVPDAPEGLLQQPMPIVGAWAQDKYKRCREQIWIICDDLLKQDIDIVIDGSAANKEQRDFIRKKAVFFNVDFQLYYTTADKDTRLKRVQKRNEEKGETYSLEVTPDMFIHAETFFTAPKEEELLNAIVL